MPKIHCAIYVGLEFVCYWKIRYLKNEASFPPRNFSLSSKLFSLGIADLHQRP